MSECIFYFFSIVSEASNNTLVINVISNVFFSLFIVKINCCFPRREQISFRFEESSDEQLSKCEKRFQNGIGIKTYFDPVNMMDCWVCNIVGSVMDYGHVCSVVLRYHSLAVDHFAYTENGYKISICVTK